MLFQSKILMLVIPLLIIGCASTTDDKTKKSPKNEAISHLLQLSRWTVEPELWLNACNNLEPSKTSQRQIVFDKWETDNKAGILYAQNIINLAGNKALPSLKSKGATPLAFINAKTTIDIKKSIYFSPHDNKLKMCSKYEELPPLSSLHVEQNEISFKFLETWYKNQSENL